MSVLHTKRRLQFIYLRFTEVEEVVNKSYN